MVRGIPGDPLFRVGDLDPVGGDPTDGDSADGDMADAHVVEASPPFGLSVRVGDTTAPPTLRGRSRVDRGAAAIVITSYRSIVRQVGVCSFSRRVLVCPM